jgi:hypothetical protein
MYINLCEENVSVKTVMITEQMKPCLLCFKVIFFFLSLRFTLKPVLTSLIPPFPWFSSVSTSCGVIFYKLFQYRVYKHKHLQC